jgi:putative membrane protein
MSFINKTILVLAIGSIFANAPVLAVDPPAPAKAQDTKAAVPASDQQFALKAALAGHAEVAAGKLAQSRGTADVQKFGAQMVEDHSKAGAELKQIADAKGMKLPDGPDAAQKALGARLERLQGPEFDHFYVQEAGVKDHKAAVDLFSAEANNGKDPELKAFAAKTLPTIKHHYQMAQDLAKSDKIAKR